MKGIEIPKAEEWLYASEQALLELLNSLKDADEGRVCNIGSFQKYLEE